MRLITSIINIILLVLYMTTGLAYAQAETTTTSGGAVDLVSIDGDRLVAQGWAGARSPTQQVSSLIFKLDDKIIYEGAFEKYERPDVLKVTSRSDWLRSGWKLRFALPDNLKKGRYSYTIQARIETGEIFDLNTASASNSLYVSGLENNKALTVKSTKITLILIITLLAILFFSANKIGNLANNRFNTYFSPAYVFGAGLVLSFCILVSIGITGSSIGVGAAQSPFITSDSVNVIGVDQPIRSDEWLVLTPLAIAQFNHLPQRNPILNTNHGEDGQNMLIVGMTGVPVAHLSALAKPATWGFFIFDLRRALAWDWLFPIFGCLIALWAVICAISPGNWKNNFLVSVLFILSPYVVAWSNWPAYATFFPCIAFLCLIAILKTRSLLPSIALGASLGLAFCGFVFVLYPPWQVSLAYVFIALTVGLIFKEKLYRKITLYSLISLVVACGVSAIVLFAWWTDAKDAIQAMENTVYPGARTTVVGGSITLPVLLRGFTNFFTLQKLDSGFSNQSEIGSFFYLLLPLAFVFIIDVYKKTISSLELALITIALFILAFMFTGVPQVFAVFSLWGRVPAPRSDLALGLATIILTAIILNRGSRVEYLGKLYKFAALTISAIWGIVVYKSIGGLNDSIITGATPNILIGLFLITTAMGYYLIVGNKTAFLLVSLGLSISTTLPFNPINIAPSNLSNSLINEEDPDQDKIHSNNRILVLENMTPAMYLVASGSPVANGIFYYPQTTLWGRLDASKTFSDTYNRYQHLSFYGGLPDNGAMYQIQSPRPDVVKITVNLSKFDFRDTGAGVVTAPIADEDALRQNVGLKFLKSASGWCWFKVI